MRISDWSSDVCSSDLDPDREGEAISWHVQELLRSKKALPAEVARVTFNAITKDAVLTAMANPRGLDDDLIDAYRARRARSEEHTSELQSLMRISYAVFCFTTKKKHKRQPHTIRQAKHYINKRT